MVWFNPDSESSRNVAESSRPSATFISLRRNAYRGESSKVAEIANPFKDKKDIYLTLSNVLPQGEGRRIKGLGTSLSVDRKGQIEEKPTLPPPTPVTDSGTAPPATFATLLHSRRKAYSDAGSSVFGGCYTPATLLLHSPDRFPTICKNCESFQLQTGHPHAGRCLAGHYPKETLWDSDVRWCGQVAAFDAPRWAP